MAVRTQKLITDDLQIGMFVSGIDRPWRETPFPIQGFHIENRPQLEKIQSLCKWVYIDVQKSRNINTQASPQDFSFVSNYFEEKQRKNGREVLNLRIRTIQNDRPYKNLTNLNSEMRQARKVHKRIKDRIKHTLRALAGEGRLSLESLRDVSYELVNSVIRNPDAFAYLSRIDSHSEDVLNYSIRIASWSVLTGRHLDLTREVMSDLALAALLSKIGYTTIPQEILRLKGTPTPHVNEMLKWSLVRGVKLLRSSDAFSSRIVKLVSHHLERHDGSGFPRGVSGRHIPFLSQVIGLADYYETLVSYDFRDKPLSSAEAVRELFLQRDVLFDAYLVEEFIQAIGLYPTGSVVTLNDERLAVVIGQNKARLKPKLLILEDDRKPWEIFKRRIVDLNSPNCADFIVSSEAALSPDSEYRDKRFFKHASTF
jgi:HD-GYP domain-containing protein (c-di-GMP phosphodiesterase class II)